MAATMIVNGWINPEGKEALSEYVQASTPLFAEAGGHLISRYQIAKTVLGNESPNLVVLMSFDNAQSIQGVFDLEAYKELIPLREKGFRKLEVCIAEQ